MTIAGIRPVDISREGQADQAATANPLGELVLQRIENHISRNFPGETVSILGTMGDVLEVYGKKLIDKQEMLEHVAALIERGDWRPVWERIDQVRSGAPASQGPSLGACPPWCDPEAHRLPMDTCHFGEIFGVELTHHPYEVQGQTYLAGMHATLRQEPEAAEPVINLSGHDEATDNKMTLTEAAAVSHMLARLVAIGRAALRIAGNGPATPQCPSWCEEDHRPLELDDGTHSGPLMSVREIERDHVREGRLVLDLLLSLRRQADLKGTRVILSGFESAEAYLLTPDEAEELASKLLELAALARMEPQRPT